MPSPSLSRALAVLALAWAAAGCQAPATEPPAQTAPPTSPSSDGAAAPPAGPARPTR